VRGTRGGLPARAAFATLLLAVGLGQPIGREAVDL
jgi:hypothetical protein